MVLPNFYCDYKFERFLKQEHITNLISNLGIFSILYAIINSSLENS